MAPLVSVLITTANRNIYLKEALLSVINQSYQNLEIILIGDGAPESTHQIISDLSDSRLTYITHTNVGLTKSLNIGLSLCKGDFIARLDDDDISKSDRIEKQLDYLIRNPQIVCVGSNHIEIDKEGETRNISSFKWSSEDIPLYLFWAIPFMHSSLFFRRREVLECGGYDESFYFAQDRDLLLRLSSHFKIGFLKDPLICYRRHASSITYAQELKQKAAGLAAVDSAFSRGQFPFYLKPIQLARKLILRLPEPIVAIKNKLFEIIGARQKVG